MSTIGLPIGLIKFISEWEKDDKWDLIYGVLKKTLVIFLSVGISISLILAVFSEYFSILLFDTKDYNILILIYSFSLPFAILSFFSDAYLRGIKKFNYYVKVTIINAVLITSISIVLVYFFGILGVPIALVCTSFVVFLNFIFFLHRGKLLEFKKVFTSKVIDNSYFKPLLKIGLGALIIGLASYFTVIFLRSEIIRILGLHYNGLYQTVYSISMNYLNIFMISAAVYTIPILSELKGSKSINIEINSLLRLILIFIVPILTIIFVFREFIIIILYSKDFLSSSELFFYNFLGDYGRLLGTVFGLWLIPTSRIKALITINFAYNGLYIIGFFILIYFFEFGFISITIAYFVANVVFLIINWNYMRSANKFKFTKINFQLLYLSSFFILITFLISNYDINIGYFIILPITVVWFLIAIKRDEYSKIKELIFSKIKK